MGSRCRETISTKYYHIKRKFTFCQSIFNLSLLLNIYILSQTIISQVPYGVKEGVICERLI